MHVQTDTISVILAVYNAEPYLEHAVRSALAQPNIGEVLLIEDGSHDQSLAICLQLASEDGRIRLLQHPEGRSRGAGASRNLGLVASRCDLVAFLDADDTYLPDRFVASLRALHTHPDADGVYEAVRVVFQNSEAQTRWAATSGSSNTLITMHSGVPQDRLLESFAGGLAGSLHLNGLLLRRSLLSRIGAFDEALHESQDTVFMIKAIAMGSLIPGSLDQPVATLRVHDTNRVTGTQASTVDLVRRSRARAQALEQWAKDNLCPDQVLLIQFFNLRREAEARWQHRFHPLITAILKRGIYLRFALQHPSFVRHRLFWQLMILRPLKRLLQ